MAPSLWKRPQYLRAPRSALPQPRHSSDEHESLHAAAQRCGSLHAPAHAAGTDWAEELETLSRGHKVRIHPVGLTLTPLARACMISSSSDLHYSRAHTHRADPIPYFPPTWQAAPHGAARSSKEQAGAHTTAAWWSHMDAGALNLHADVPEDRKACMKEHFTPQFDVVGQKLQYVSTSKEVIG